MAFIEKTLNSEYIYKGKIIKLRVDEAETCNGNTAKREVIEHGGGVCVLPIDKDGNVYLVKQYRYPYSEIIAEVPAGKRDGDEQPLICGKRELQEETGITAENYFFAGELYPTPGYCGEIIYMYIATGLAFGTTSPDEDESLDVIKLPLNQAIQLVLDGEIKDAKSQSVILKAKLLTDNKTIIFKDV